MARDVGTERIPVDGRSKHSADFEDALACYQLKVRGMLPAWLFEWLDGICGWAIMRNKIGVLVLNRPRRPRADALVIVRWRDWVDLHGALKLDEEAPAHCLTGDGAAPMVGTFTRTEERKS